MEEEILYTKKGTPRKRKPKKSNVYFTDDTQAAILEYINEPNPEIRNLIYHKRIHNAFFKLTENIIHSFRFYYTEVDNLDDLKFEIIITLLDKIKGYDPSKGKAYSYFGTIVKRWLILYNTKNYKKILNRVDLKNVEVPDEEYEDKTPFINKYIKFVDDKLFTLFPDKHEQRIADAILVLMRHSSSLENVNKKALFIYIKELVPEATSIEISKVVKELRRLYNNLYNDWDKYETF